MTAPRLSRYAVFAPCMLIGVLGVNSDLAAAVPLNIVEKMRSRREICRNARWTVEGHRIVSADAYRDVLADTKPAPPESKDYSFTYTIDLVLDFERDRAQQRYVGREYNSDVAALVESEEWHLSNGLALQVYRPNSGNPDPFGRVPDERFSCELYLRTLPRFNNGLFFSDVIHAALASHGIFETPIGALRPIPLRSSVESWAQSWSVKHNPVDDSLVLVANPTEQIGYTYEAALSLSGDLAVQTLSVFSGPQLVCRMSTTEFDADDKRFPRRWRIDKWAGERLMSVDEVTVVSRDLDVDLAGTQFEIVPRTGMFVFEEATDRTYLKAKEGEPNEDGEAAVRRLRATGGGRSLSLVFVIGVHAALFVALLIWLGLRRQRRRSGTSLAEKSDV